MENFFNSSQFFRVILHARRVEFLFQSVFEKLAEQFEVRKIHVLRSNSTLASYPQLPPHVPNKVNVYQKPFNKKLVKHTQDIGTNKSESSSGSEIEATSSSEDDEPIERGSFYYKHGQNFRFLSFARKCLRVCEIWKQAVEHCYQKPLMTGIKGYFEDLRPAHRIIPWARYMIDCRENEVQDETRILMETNSLSSFREQRLQMVSIGKSLSLKLSDDTSIQNFFALNTILGVIGELILYVSFNFDGHCGGKMSTFLQVVNYLRLMPNLKALEITGGFLGEKFSDEFISQNRLPNLKHLEMLRLKYTHETVSILFLQKYNHISHLTVTGINNIETRILTSLAYLQTFCTKGLLFEHNVLDTSSWQLSKLQFTIQNLIECPLYFHLLNEKYSNTLVDLCIRNEREIMVWKESKYLKLMLSRLKRFSIHMTSIFFLDFILPLKNSLENLEIKCTHENAENISHVKVVQNIDFVGFQDQMQNSNIWTMFKKLKMIKIQFNPGDIKKRIWLYTKTLHGIEREEIVYK